MISSLWRYSHFLLAIISALFLIVASITGAILAIEPIAESSQGYAVVDLEDISLSEAIKVLKENYNEVVTLEITSENFVKTSVITNDGSSENIYINPITADSLGNVPSRSPFFSSITNLHRSLFLKSIGRAFVGIFSLLLCFIAVTGVFLLAQRQGGFKRWFVKVQERDIVQRYHVILGRWFLIPILLIGITGVYLSAEKFSLFPEDTTTHDWGVIPSQTLKEKPVSEFTLFQNLTLNDVRKLSLPFSEDAEDYFELALTDRELLVHQYTGEIISQIDYPFIQLASRLSMQLHTGEGSVLWSVILLLASLSLLFFMFSGFAMSFKRFKKTKSITSEWTKDEAEFILLVGSETGSTFVFAKAFYVALQNVGKKVCITTLNEYSTYKNAIHLIVFTATYGDGDAPSNARNFEARFNNVQPKRDLQFSVVGFGSLRYHQYCRFALKVDALFHSHSNFIPTSPLTKINDSSNISFIDWVKIWNKHTGINLKVTLLNQKQRSHKRQSFKVIKRTTLNVDDTMLLTLRPKNKNNFQSGDLLNITPPKDTFARQYSIAKMDGDILLSIKWHSKGLCSTYLCSLEEDDVISGRIEENAKFHFPEQVSSVWLVANGTGIAPYLGMLSNNTRTPIELLWGGRTEASFDCYREILESSLSRKRIKNDQLALSQEGNKKYVQDILLSRRIEVAQTLKQGGVFMLCGSLAMQHSVLDALEDITTTQLQQPLVDFKNNKQILLDCY